MNYLHWNHETYLCATLLSPRTHFRWGERSCAGGSSLITLNTWEEVLSIWAQHWDKQQLKVYNSWMWLKCKGKECTVPVHSLLKRADKELNQIQTRQMNHFQIKSNCMSSSPASPLKAKDILISFYVFSQVIQVKLQASSWAALIVELQRNLTAAFNCLTIWILSDWQLKH